MIISIRGGLGNQLCGYAMYLLFKEKGVNVKLDVETCYTEKVMNATPHNKYMLEEYFDIKAEYASKKEIKKYSNLVSKGLLRLGLSHLYPGYVYVDAHNQYEPKVVDLKEGYLDGYWMDVRYFQGACERLLRDKIQYKSELTENNKTCLHNIQRNNSVSIHVRRGDYLNLTHIYSILDEKYYNACVDYVVERMPDAQFYCFSNDIQWCQENLRLPNVVYVDGNDAGADFYLMSQCKHNIIANSSYSIWAALMNSNPEKVVLRPKEYFVDKSFNSEGYYPSEWIVIDNNDFIK